MQRTHTIRLALVVTVMILSGMLGAETGTTLERIGSTLLLGEVALGWIVSSRFLGGIIASVAVLAFPPRRRVLPAFLVCAGLVVGSLIPLSLARSFSDVFLAGILRGVATGLAIPVANYTISLWFSRLPGRYAGIVHGSFGIGLILTPLAGRALLAAGLAWPAVWWLAVIPAGLLLAVGPAVARVVAVDDASADAPADPPVAERATDPADQRDTRAAWLLQALVLCVVGAEAVVIGWVPTAVGVRSPVATETLALVVSVAILVGRFGAGMLADRVGVMRYHRITVIALALTLAFPTGSRHAWWAVAHVGAAGLAMAAVYPTMAAVAVQRFRSARRRTFMAMGLSGAIGGSIVPTLVGYLAHGSGRWAVARGAVPALLLVLAIGLAFMPPRRNVSVR